MKSSGRTGIIVAGALGGALLGALFAWLISKSDEEEGASLGLADYFQLGIGVLTLARQFGAMVGKKD
ncbi:MAG: hypothetical protein D6790_19245 [Caldilineae bacterium]|nr:MAG: hypothetical protein D6790_19245 [Caldilineae bacterium]